MKVIKKIDQFIFDKVLGILAKVFGLTMLVSVVLQISGRYLLLTPIRWTEEMSRLTFVWFCFTAAAMTFAQNKHLSMDFLYRKLNDKVRHLLDIVGQVAILIFSLVISYYGIGLLKLVALQQSPMLRISMKYFYASVPFGGILFAIKSLLNIFHYLSSSEHLEPVD